MNTALWIVQVVLAVVFGLSGVLKATWSKERLVASGQTGVKNLKPPLIRFIAMSELCGAIGLIGPWLTSVLPVLTPIAALCLGLVMVLAAVVHTRQREPESVFKNVLLLAACVFVAHGRFQML